MLGLNRFLIVMCLVMTTHMWASIGKVSLLKGEATAQRNQEIVKLFNNAPIETQDRIVTAENSQIQLIFEDKTVITLGSASVLDIQEYLNSSTQPKAKFKFNQGTFKSITGDIGKKAPENFNLETQTATIGIRGTTVGGEVPPPPPPNVPPLPENLFCLEGTITVAPMTMPTLLVVVPTGSFTQMTTPSTPPSPPVPYTPADLQKLHQNLGGDTPPPPSATSGRDDARQPSGNTPPTLGNSPFNDGGSNTPPSGGGSGISPSGSVGSNSNPPPMPQTFTPASAMIAAQSNTQNFTQNQVVNHTATQLGITPETLRSSMNNPPNSGGGVTIPCPAGTTGTYPNCVTPTCPAGTTGTYPNCYPIVNLSLL